MGITQNTVVRGSVWFANLDPAIGGEPGKTRPVVVFQNKAANEFSSTVTIISMSSQEPHTVLPYEVWIPKEESGLREDSRVLVNQIRTIDKTRLFNPVGQITDAKLDEIAQALMIHLGITEF